MIIKRECHVTVYGVVVVLVALGSGLALAVLAKCWEREGEGEGGRWRVGEKGVVRQMC